MFSQTSEYALRAVVWLAATPDEPMTTQVLARHTRVPAGYLAKVMQALTRAGLLESRRGPNGGFRLVKPPEEITALEVINAVDPLSRIHRCPLNLPSHRGRLCALHKRLDAAMEKVETVLAESTIAELLSEPNPIRPLRET